MERCGGPIFPDSGFKDVYNEIYVKKNGDAEDVDLKSTEKRKEEALDGKQDSA